MCGDKAEAEALNRQHLQELIERYEAETTAVREEHALARETIERNHEPADQKSRRELEQAIWLADSVLEFAQNQARTEDKRIKEIVKTYTEAIDGIDAQGLRLLGRYGVKPPTEVKAVEAAGSSSEQDARDADEVPEIADPQAKMAAELATAQQRVAHLSHLVVPSIFVGVTPWVSLILFCIVAGIAAQASRQSLQPDFQHIAIAVGSTFVGTLLLGFLLRIVARRQVLEAYKPLVQSLGTARRASAAFAEHSRREQAAKYARAVKKAAIKKSVV